MVECPVCKKQMSEFATQCPHCKSPVAKHIATTNTSTINKPAQKEQPIYLNYVIIAIFAILAAASARISRLFETTVAAKFWGRETMAVLSLVQGQLNLILLGLCAAIVAMVALTIYRLAAKQKQSIALYLGLSAIVILLFFAFCRIISAQADFREFVPEHLVDTLDALLKNMSLYYTLLIPVYIMVSYWCVHRLGLAKGLLVSVINFIIAPLLLVLRLPLVLQGGFGIEMFYFFAFPLTVDIIEIGVAFLVGCIKK